MIWLERKVAFGYNYPCYTFGALRQWYDMDHKYATKEGMTDL
jgi:hypothetical protein